MLGDRLEKEWRKETDSKAKNHKPSLFKALVRCFGKRYALLGVFTFFEECILRVFQPLFMGRTTESCPCVTSPVQDGS